MECSKEIEALLDSVQAGDMIEFDRGCYSHWAVYVGENCVVHRWGENDGIGQPIGLRGNITTIFGEHFNKAKIMKTKIWLVHKGGNKVRVNNGLDSKYKPLPITDIVARANGALGQEGYNLIYDNCEHFATDCRYGQSTSRQVQTVVAGSLAGGILMTGIAALVAYSLYNSQKKEDEEQQKKTKTKMNQK